MFSRLFRRPSAPTLRPSLDTSVPRGAVVWAIGDIHGRLDLLEPLLGRILLDFEATHPERSVLVFLGDYIDRGSASKQVIDLLCGLQDHSALECHFLKGNHEDRLEAFLDDPSIGPGWSRYGGREALTSYGVEAPPTKAPIEDWTRASAQLGKIMSPRQRRFFASLKTHVEIGDFFFVHAGVRPETPLSEQSEYDMLWIRDSFLNHNRLFERVIVHGHTPASSVFSDTRRIGLDTGAYSSGALTAVRLQDTERRFLQAISRDDTKSVIWVAADE